MAEKKCVDLDNVSETLLITLYTRACESQRPDVVFKDEESVEMVKQIDYDFSRGENASP